MLDKPRKASRRLAVLKAPVPFEVELAPTLIEYLQAENLSDADRKKHVVSDLSYVGDEVGIICHLTNVRCLSDSRSRAMVDAICGSH